MRVQEIIPNEITINRRHKQVSVVCALRRGRIILPIIASWQFNGLDYNPDAL